VLVQSAKTTFHHTQFSSEVWFYSFTYFLNECSVYLTLCSLLLIV